jgi:hypothetical protein
MDNAPFRAVVIVLAVIRQPPNVEARFRVTTQPRPSRVLVLFLCPLVRGRYRMGKTSDMPRDSPLVRTALALGLRGSVLLLGSPVQVAARKMVRRIPIRRRLAGRGNVIVFDHPLTGLLDGFSLEVRLGFRIKCNEDRVGKGV